MWCWNFIILVVLAVSLAESVSTAGEDVDAKPEDIGDANTMDSPDIADVNIPGVDAPMPTREQLLKVLESMAGLSQEEKENLRQDLLRSIQEKQEEHNDRSTLSNNFFYAHPALLLFTLLGLISLVFVFFIHKLYTNVTLKERQREEKRRAKKSKKNK